MKLFSLLVAIGFLVLTIGCQTGPKSAKGFALPDGDVAKGKAIFLELGCNACHTVSGADVPPVEEQQELSVALGGELSRVKTHGELVASIINPSHRLAKGYPQEEIAADGTSKMKIYNDVMTVSQLIDLVAFLQSHYTIREYEPMDYPPYY